MPVTKAEFDEIFPRPLIREVACEIRFAPRLRVNPEVWRIQDKLADDYPQLDQESVALAEGRLLQSYLIHKYNDKPNRQAVSREFRHYLQYLFIVRGFQGRSATKDS